MLRLTSCVRVEVLLRKLAATSEKDSAFSGLFPLTRLGDTALEFPRVEYRVEAAYVVLKEVVVLSRIDLATSRLGK